jgi:hypothetical protein
MGGMPFEALSPAVQLSGIIEAKSPEEFRDATPQITAHLNNTAEI